MSLPLRKPIPLAPAPARLGSTKIRAVEATDELSTSSSDEDAQNIVAPPASSGLYAELEGDSEDEFGIEEHFVDEEQTADREELIRNRISTSQEQMKSILAGLNEGQLQRYETFRRVGFPRPMIKKIMGKVLDNLTGSGNTNGGKDKVAINLNPSTVIVISGIAKVFVGELVEEARIVQEEWNDENKGPLTPAHILEAQRRLKSNLTLPSSCNYKKRSAFL